MWPGTSRPTRGLGSQHAQQNPQYLCACDKSYAQITPLRIYEIPHQGCPGSDHIQLSISKYLSTGDVHITVHIMQSCNGKTIQQGIVWLNYRRNP
ncbi:hypothetical protein L3X38_042185 [Prunus dulcis]|uniref:Uncharacterized protein n=1 Tax=Prunus dulcis TaxID=3755 RepID=A0AAD4YKZ5_PRUDU|nr:hypothetical protein L3X38_042185 [Prunus dulcis]